MNLFDSCRFLSSGGRSAQPALAALAGMRRALPNLGSGTDTISAGPKAPNRSCSVQATLDRGDPMAQGRPVEADVRARAIELIQAGMPRNAIARELQIAPSSVSTIARDEGLTFDRATQTASATA